MMHQPAGTTATRQKAARDPRVEAVGKPLKELILGTLGQ